MEHERGCYTMAQVKVQMTFPQGLLERMDRYCKANYMTRSGLAQQAIASFLTAHEMADGLQELTRTVKALADKTGTPEDLKQLEEVEHIIEMMQGGMR